MPELGVDYQVCEKCGGHLPGGIYPVRLGACDCNRRRRLAEEAIARVDVEEAMFFEGLVNADSSVVEAREKLEAIARGERGKGMMMFGLPGRGKTHLSVALIRDLLLGGKRVGFHSLAGLVSRVQETYSFTDAAETRTKIVSELALNDVVVIDDIGKERQTQDVESIVYEIFDALYNSRTTLVASSNMPGKDFAARYDGAVLSRLGGLCEKIVIRGEDRRAAAWDW
jgi:DNA replication protein DnaC